MLYRILAFFALFFFSACGGTQQEPPTASRKPVNSPSATAAAPAASPVLTPARPNEKVVKIGLLVPLTGDASKVGTALLDAATMALMDKYGAQDNGPIRVVLVPKDTQNTPAGAAEAARQVLASGAQLIVGPLYSTQVASVAEVARQYGVNVLTFSNNPEVAGGNVYVFGFLADQQVKRIVNYALNQNLTRIALLAPKDAYGQTVQKTARQVLAGANLSLAAETYFNPAGMPGAEVETLAAAHAQTPFSAMLLPVTGQTLQTTVQALAAKGVAQPNLRLLGTGVWDEAPLLRSGALTGGWFASSPPDRFSAYSARFKENFGYAPPRISALAYDALALASALASHSADGRISAAAVTESSGYNGPVNGIFRCLKSGICERGLAVMEVTGNGAKVIDPAPSSF